MADRRILILAEGRFSPIDAKTATCVIAASRPAANGFCPARLSTMISFHLSTASAPSADPTGPAARHAMSPVAPASAATRPVRRNVAFLLLIMTVSSPGGFWCRRVWCPPEWRRVSAGRA